MNSDVDYSTEHGWFMHAPIKLLIAQVCGSYGTPPQLRSSLITRKYFTRKTRRRVQAWKYGIADFFEKRICIKQVVS